MRISKSIKPRVCVTMGYPAGIGPEVIARAMASHRVRRLANFLIVGDAFVFRKAQALCKKNLRHIKYGQVTPDKNSPCEKEKLFFLDLSNVPEASFCFGRVSASYGRASIEYIRKGASLVQSRKADILVTAPMHKYAAKLAGFTYAGHTEFLSDLTGAAHSAMMLIGGPLKVALVTTHLRLKSVPAVIKKDGITGTALLLNRYFKKYYHIRRPRIAVCGLNPHAGEDGTLGKEEVRVIKPAVEYLRCRGMSIFGPLPADAVFCDLYRGEYDAALCMYHDQGLTALKMIARNESVNVTLGLPFIRTSPGHGTALDIAPKGRASAASMIKAIEYAVAVYMNKRNV